jgi:hypothetical protein
MNKKEKVCKRERKCELLKENLYKKESELEKNLLRCLPREKEHLGKRKLKKNLFEKPSEN